MAIAIIPVLQNIFSVGVLISQQILKAKINQAQCIRLGEHWLWRLVNQDGYELDVLLQSRQDKQAAKRFLRNCLSD